MKCKLCGNSIRQTQGRKRTRCGPCNTKIRRQRCKQAAVNFLGGGCVQCGYDENIAAFVFHHKDPSKKSFNIGAVSNKSWERIKEELLKCELLCANCHAIEHSNRDDKYFLAEVDNYQGRILN